MLSEKQAAEKAKRILLAAKTFMENDFSLAEVEKATGISSSSVQRYLHDEELIALVGLPNYEIIQQKLLVIKKDALSKGGKNSAINNDFTKDELGRFTGSIKR